MIDSFGYPIRRMDKVAFAKTVGRGGVELAVGVVMDESHDWVRVKVIREPFTRAGYSQYMDNHPKLGQLYKVTVPNRLMNLSRGV